MELTTLQLAITWRRGFGGDVYREGGGGGGGCPPLLLEEGWVVVWCGGGGGGGGSIFACQHSSNGFAFRKFTFALQCWVLFAKS